MKTLGRRVLVTKVEEVKKEGDFSLAETQDNFVYKGKVEQIGEQVRLHDETSYYHGSAGGGGGASASIATANVRVGDIILFAKYSPDTHEIKHEGVTYKFVAISDILAVV